MAYETDLERALAAAYPLRVRNVYPRRLLALPGRRFRQILAAVPDPGWAVTVRGFLPALALGIRRPRGRQVVLIHHVDHSEVPHRGVSARLERLFARAIPRADRLVVVAEYWRCALAPLAPEVPVTVIPNGFPVDDYGITPEERIRFRRAHGFDDRPLVYLGNCQAAKGVIEAEAALRGLGWQLVTSGRREAALPAPNLELSGDDYRRLLAAADAVLAMSRFLEGWNRTAHEALLSGTPVVGRPVGGLGELLAGAGQLAVEDPSALPAAVSEALSRREELGARGREFARGFTLERFGRAWTGLIGEELGALRPGSAPHA